MMNYWRELATLNRGSNQTKAKVVVESLEGETERKDIHVI